MRSSRWKQFQGKILRRCDRCGSFSAAYRVEDPQGGLLRLCRACWEAQARTGLSTKAPPSPPEDHNDPAKPA